MCDQDCKEIILLKPLVTEGMCPLGQGAPTLAG